MLTQEIDSYLELRRALGVSCIEVEERLRRYARVAVRRGETYVRAETVIAWAATSPSAPERARRLRTVARFARHVRAIDDRHEVPRDDLFAHSRRRPVPYIFSDADVQRLLVKARLLSRQGSLRPLTYSTLFALLVATGLRIGEALALRFEHLTVDGLVIHQTKFGKSRLVPLHESTVEGLGRYLEQRSRIPTEVEHFFVDRRGRPLAYSAVRLVFRQIIRDLGLWRGVGHPRPCLHSLRHTFATRALLRCPHQRDHVDRHLIALSTYLGHSSVSATYWYLEATPQLLTDIAEACDAFRGEVAR